MPIERWQQVKQVFQSTLEREPGRRTEFLAEACGSDHALRDEVEALLVAHEGAGSSFLETFTVALPARLGVTLPPGTRLGSYETSELIGEGGMGEVYRARDTRLGRDVAIKILSGAFTKDADRLARFEREARVLATLNHPHIGAIYGIVDGPEDADLPARALVLELVEGETLAERIARSTRPGGSPLRLDEVLKIAQQIAEGLEAAHEKGVVHRDLKPANIKITPDGIVKVLDFGLAKPVIGDGLGVSLSQAPTIDASADGLIVGTAAYMSPEQARGAPVDKRADIWAFGCVLYEMLSGRTAFGRETVTDTLAAVVEREPDWSGLPGTLPSAVRRLLKRCLDKDPKRRLRDIGDVRFELEQLAAPPAETAAPDRAERPRKRTIAVAAVSGVLLAAAGGLGFWLSGRGPADLRVSRFTVNLPKDTAMVPTFNSNLALSPNGASLAFTPLAGPVQIRRLDSLESEPLEVTKSGSFFGAPVFSPDSASLSFVEGNAIFSQSRPFLKAALSGGAPFKLAEYDAFHSGDWGTDGKIYWTASYPGGIVRIPDSGGPVESVTKLDVEHGERSHRFANLLPDGKALIYTVALDGIASYNDARIDLWDLNTGVRKPLINGGTSAVYSPSGHIVFARAGKLLAVPFDVDRKEITGPEFEVLDGVMMSSNTGAAHFTLSRERGDLAYVPGSADGGHRTLVWVDRAGNAEPLPLAPASYLYPRISPDGRTLAVEIEGPNHDFYFYDFARGILSRITTDGMSHDPVWARDGKTLAFRSWLAGGMTMWLMAADRSGSPVRLDPTGTRQSPVSFSPDGKFLTFDQKDPKTGDDALILPVSSNAAALPLAKTKFAEGSAKFSPDGRWIAYASNESGKPEVYVQPFPGLGPKVQISDVGWDPVWRPSGGELYYRKGDSMMVVTVAKASPELWSAPKELWKGNYASGSGSSCGMPGMNSSSYDVTADGRFLMVRDDDQISATRINVVLNFAEEIKEKELKAKEKRSRPK